MSLPLSDQSMHFFGFLDAIELQFQAFELKIDRLVPLDSFSVRIKGFCSICSICSTLLRRLHADMHKFRCARTFSLSSYLRVEATKHRTKSFSTNFGTISKNMPTNFEPERLKSKIDIYR